MINKIKNNYIIYVSLILLIIILLAIIFLIGFSKPINISKNFTVEVNTDVFLKDLITDVTTDNIKIDTSKLGKQTINAEYKYGKISITINVVDTIKPVINASDIVTITVGETINLLDNVSAEDNSREDIIVSTEGEYNFNKVGNYNLKYVASDLSGNKAEKDFVLKVIPLKDAPLNYTEYKSMNDGKYITSKGYTLTIKNGIAYVEGLLIVNKTYSLPKSYKPVNPYSNKASSGDCINCIDKTTMEAFKKMQADAKNNGLNLYLSSGYRPYNTQSYLFNYYSRRDGEESADKYSARAGHSEHQSGYCFDLNTINSSFANTDEGKWVNENAYLYGFIIRYPKGKEDITGYNYESWHLRYVGLDLAKKLYNNGEWVTMEEYFGITSKYK